MFGLGKTKRNSISIDNTLVDHSKKIIFGIAVLFFTVLIFIGIEIYTSSKLISQTSWIAKGNSSKEQSNKLMMVLAKIGKDVKNKEYQYLKTLNHIMSPTEFQNFKNSISSISSKNNISINSLKEGKPIMMKNYSISTINLTAISKYQSYVNFKKDLTDIKYKINFEDELITRENPTSKNITITATISALVSEKKQSLFVKKKKFYEKMKKKELNLPKKLKKIENSVETRDLSNSELFGKK